MEYVFWVQVAVLAWFGYEDLKYQSIPAWMVVCAVPLLTVGLRTIDQWIEFIIVLAILIRSSKVGVADKVLLPFIAGIFGIWSIGTGIVTGLIWLKRGRSCPLVFTTVLVPLILIIWKELGKV